MKSDRKVKRLLLGSFFLFSFYAPLLVAQDSTGRKLFQLHGYVKEMQTTAFSSLVPGTANDNLIHNRLNFKWFATANATVAIELRNRVFWGETVSLSPNYGALFEIDPGVVDLAFVWFNENDWLFTSQIDRAYFNWNNDQWEVRIGRQRINWGITSLWNSNDLFNAYTFTDFDYEERPGSDAIRVQRYFGGMNSFEVAIKPSLNDSTWVGAMIYRFNKWQYDFQVLGGWYNDDYALGVGWAGNIKMTSFKGEATYFHPQESFLDTLGALSLSTSIDYLFPRNIYGSIGYLYNSIGLNTALNFSNMASFSAPVSAKSLMPARHSTMLSVSFPVNALLSVSIAGVYSPRINFLLAMPSISYSLSASSEIALFTQNYWMGNNLDNIGNGIYLRLKYSF